MFHFEIAKFQNLYHFVFTGIKVEKIGLKIDQVTYSYLECRSTLLRFEMEEKLTPFGNNVQIFKNRIYGDINNGITATFHIKISSTTSNFDYQMVDTTCMDQLWAAAQKQTVDRCRVPCR